MPLNTRYRGMIDVQGAHIATLRMAIVVLIGLCAFLWWGWASAPNQITVHVPPDLRTGASSHVHDIPPENVYLFAEYIFQQLQRWESDGSKDFAANIYQLQHYLTPEYQNLLLADYKQRFGSGQLNKVARGMQPLADSTFTPEKVQIVVPHSAWVVFLDGKILEWVAGMKTKDTDIRFPLRVVRLDVDREKNPWGLALAGYPDGIFPEAIEEIRKREVSQR